jgi:hypothetical protein
MLNQNSNETANILGNVFILSIGEITKKYYENANELTHGICYAHTFRQTVGKNISDALFSLVLTRIGKHFQDYFYDKTSIKELLLEPNLKILQKTLKKEYKTISLDVVKMLLLDT